MGWYSGVARISWRTSGKLLAWFLRESEGFSALYSEGASSVSLLLPDSHSTAPLRTTVMVDGSSSPTASAPALGVVST